MIAGDTVTLSAANANFAQANVGTAIAVSAAYTLAGADAGNYTLAQPSGLAANITAAPLTVTGASAADKVYDRTTTGSITGATLTGVIAGDTVNLSAANANFAQSNVGTGIAVSTAYTLSGANAGNYTLAQPSGLAANITAASLTVTGATAADKVYDRTSTAAITGAALTGVIAGDSVNLSAANADFAQSNVGIGIAVSTAFTLSGASAGNYTVVQPSGLAANITAASLTVTGAVVSNKVYDATTTAAIGGASLTGVIAGDSVNISAANASFAQSNVGTGIAVSTAYTLSGASAANYTLAQPTGLAADITVASLTVSGASAANRVYDRTTTASVTGGTLTGVISGDTVTLSAANANFAQSDVGAGIAVSTAYTLSGASAANYALTQPGALAANITAASLTVTGASAADKVYDRTTTASVTGASLSGVIASDTIILSAANANFAQANVGSGLAVSTAYTLSGSNAGNYTLAQPSGLSASITPASLTVSGAVASNKVYDTTTVASIAGGSLSGVVGGDAVALSAANASFAQSNVGAGIAVSTAYTLSGASSGNYTLAQPSGLAANIAPAPLTIAADNQSMTYGGSMPSLTVSYSGFVGGESAANLAATPTVSSATLATANAGTYTDTLTASGAVAGNYAINYAPGTLTIGKASLTISGLVAADKVYDRTTSASVTGGALSGLLGGDLVNLLAVNANFAQSNAGSGIQVLTAVTLSGLSAGNYTVAQPSGLVANITAAPLTVSGASAANKVFDGTTAASVTGGSLAGVIAGDSVNLSAANASFAQASVGTSIAVSTAYALIGASAANYILSQPVGLAADIVNITAPAPSAIITAPTLIEFASNYGILSTSRISQDSTVIPGTTANEAYAKALDAKVLDGVICSAAAGGLGLEQNGQMSGLSAAQIAANCSVR